MQLFLFVRERPLFMLEGTSQKEGGFLPCYTGYIFYNVGGG
jgi:hypothetical protein